MAAADETPGPSLQVIRIHPSHASPGAFPAGRTGPSHGWKRCLRTTIAVMIMPGDTCTTNHCHFAKYDDFPTLPSRGWEPNPGAGRGSRALARVSCRTDTQRPRRRRHGQDRRCYPVERHSSWHHPINAGVVETSADIALCRMAGAGRLPSDSPRASTGMIHRSGSGTPFRAEIGGFHPAAGATTSKRRHPSCCARIASAIYRWSTRTDRKRRIRPDHGACSPSKSPGGCRRWYITARLRSHFGSDFRDTRAAP